MNKTNDKGDQILKDLFVVNYKEMTPACYHAKEGQYMFWLTQYPEAPRDYNGHIEHGIFWKVQVHRDRGECVYKLETAWENYTITTKEAAEQLAREYYEKLWSIE